MTEMEALPPGAPQDYAGLCDWLETRLLHDLTTRLATVVTATEASHRDGETLSVRVAAWHIDLEVLNSLDLPPWEVLELARYSEIYSQPWHDDFAQAVVRTYHDVITSDTDDFFGLRFCPRCGSRELEHSQALDVAHDEMYYLVRCGRCDWSDWTQ